MILEQLLALTFFYKTQIVLFLHEVRREIVLYLVALWISKNIKLFINAFLSFILLELATVSQIDYKIMIISRNIKCLQIIHYYGMFFLITEHLKLKITLIALWVSISCNAHEQKIQIILFIFPHRIVESRNHNKYVKLLSQIQIKM